MQLSRCLDDGDVTGEKPFLYGDGDLGAHLDTLLCDFHSSPLLRAIGLDLFLSFLDR